MMTLKHCKDTLIRLYFHPKGKGPKLGAINSYELDLAINYGTPVWQWLCNFSVGMTLKM